MRHPIDRRFQDEPVMLFVLGVTRWAGSVQPGVRAGPAMLREHT